MKNTIIFDLDGTLADISERKEKIRSAVKTFNTAASKSAKFAGGMSKAFDPKGGSSFESYIQRQTLHLME